MASSYVDLKDGGQVEIVSEDVIRCQGRVRVEGRVSEISGPGKGGGTHTEVYVRATRWACVEPR